MKINVVAIDSKKAGSVDVSDLIFAIEPRADIVARVVKWQLAKRRAGTHKVKGRSEIARTKAKMYNQKGTGRARHGELLLFNSAVVELYMAHNCVLMPIL